MEKKTDALAVNGTRKLEAEVVLYSGNAEINRELERAQTLQTGDFYTVGGKTVPNARALQWLANRKNIKTRIMEVQSTKDYCRATVSGWIGNSPTPETNHNYKEATCEMIFEVEIAEKVLEMIYKENQYREKYRKEPLIEGKDWVIGGNGLPMFTNEKMQSKMMREILRMRKFALRTVVTKAERIIHSKLADVEWREEDEMQDEVHEVELVSGKKISPIIERAAEPLPAPVNPEPIIIPEQSQEETEADKEFVKSKSKRTRKPKESKPEYPFQPDIIKETPFATLEAIMDKALLEFTPQLVRPIIEEIFPRFYADADLEDIPEDKLIAIIERLTGVRMETE